MDFPRSFFITDRFFYFLGGSVSLFLLSYSFAPLFDVAVWYLCLLTATVLIDTTILYRRRSTRASRELADQFSLHDPNKVTIHLENCRNMKLRLKVIDEIPPQLDIRDLKFSVAIAAFEKRTLEYALTPLLRGEYGFGNIHVFVSSALGLVRRRETVTDQRHVAVYPSVHQMARNELMARSNPTFRAGEHTVRRRGRSYEFDQIKAYVQGDDTRSINWKASSVMRELMVNQYDDEKSQNVYAVIDKSRVMKKSFGGMSLFDHAVNAALAFTNIVLKKHDKAGLIIFSKQIDTVVKAESSPRQLRRIMHALYREAYDFSESDFAALYSTIRSTVRNRSLIFLYTDFNTMQSLERNLPVLRLISRHHLLVVVFFHDTELHNYSRREAAGVIDVYHLTIARRFLLEKQQVALELKRNGIIPLMCKPGNLTSDVISTYMELKSTGKI